jgi:hypothetical protein
MKGGAMNRDASEFWNQVSPALRRHLKLTPPTLEEAEAEFQAAEESPLSEEQIDSILYSAKTGQRRQREKKKLLPDWLRSMNLSQVSQEMIPALARNAGAKDEEVEALLESLREEALEEALEEDTEEDTEATSGKEQPQIQDTTEPREESD